MARLNVREIKTGDQFTGFYLVKSKRQLTTRAGKPYLDLDVADATGSVNCKVWDDAENFSSMFGRGDVIKIRASAEEFQGKPQLKIFELRPLQKGDEVDMSDLIRTTPYNVEEMLDYLRGEIGSMKDPDLAGLMSSFFGDEEFVEEFSRAAAARNVHHVYRGGLLEHTVKVVKTCMFAADALYPGQVDRDLLFAGAVLHDAGKTRELDSEMEISYTTEGYLAGHLMLGVMMTAERARSIPGFPESRLLDLLHVIISHHGEKEWGSPVVPMTAEAMIVHNADNLDAKTQIALTAISEDPNQEENFTQYHRLLGRHFYKGGRGVEGVD